ncbi:cell wall metabolism sensor histidine kinase WalK [Planomicrobium sp. CPCC 101110]|uniref:sensor histidine kinase n=1 Tax=Planomicrobium sp. CPCC 101110 TaxID=2599619 RepID=UPI0011B5293D|nr:HAMP domain-containing sensor histidine kinase [Planomicrobium sp. CPCC 101110]TWT28255.1 HAMP domain-containing histidine kinase [Planomicrobium sp. CPCC 101110]
MRLPDVSKKRPNAEQADVFSRTGKNLTLFYSGIISLFLIVFVIITLLILYQVLINEQEQNIRSLAEREMGNILRSIDGDSRKQGEGRRFLSENQLFLYVTDIEGQTIEANESIDELRPFYMRFLEHWTPERTEIRTENIKIPDNDPEFSRFRDFDIRILMLAEPVVTNGQTVGMMYLGLDISFLNNIFRWVLIVFVSIAALFIGIGVLLSLWMSKRALVPIQQAYIAQQEFVSDASHELRTPLSVILSAVEALDMETDANDPFARKMLSTLKFEVKRMTKLIDELLALARSDSGQIVSALKREWFDIRPAALAVMESLGKSAGEKSIDLQLSAPHPMNVFGDQDKLTQLIYILVENAIKYTAEGGSVEIVIGKSCSKKGQEFSLSVADNGIGLTEEEQEKVFDRFYRADKARTRKEGGYGLGLSIARSIAEAHKGDIEIESKLGQGTMFWVKLPFSE